MKPHRRGWLILPLLLLSLLLHTGCEDIELTGYGDSTDAPFDSGTTETGTTTAERDDALPELSPETESPEGSPTEETSGTTWPEDDRTDSASAGNTAGDTSSHMPGTTDSEASVLDENGTYTSAEDVSLYLVTYGELPQNFITKNEARDLGWSGGSLEPYAPGKCIGGDRFGNYEGILPEDARYHECDIDTLGANSRGAKRLVFSEDGNIYYTEDHYQTFTLLYGEG